MKIPAVTLKSQRMKTRAISVTATTYKMMMTITTSKRVKTGIDINAGYSSRRQPNHCAYSGPIRPPIPLEGGHPIRSNPASHSGEFRPPVPE